VVYGGNEVENEGGFRVGKTTLYIVRHGETEWNVEKRLQGHHDSPLTQLGELQADWLHEALKEVEFDGIYTSSSQRAVRTTEIISRQQKSPIVKVDQLREMYLGEWEGKRQSDLLKSEPHEFQSFWHTPHLFQPTTGESFLEVQDRVIDKLKQIHRNHYSDSPLLIVTHTVVVKVLMAYFEGRPLSNIWDPPYLHPACLCKVEFDGDKSTIYLHGDTSHYKKPL
jgi:probable phosphoglycerate mutase